MKKRLTVHRETEKIFNAKFSTGCESLGPMLVRTMSRLIQKKRHDILIFFFNIWYASTIL